MGVMTIRAIAGARVSHVQGSEKLSHLVQHAVGKAYADQRGWEMVGTFEDLNVSAIKFTPWERPDLGPWLTDKHDEWDALIVPKTDRLFRKAKDALALGEWAKEYQKIIVIADDGIILDYYHPEADQDPWSRMMAQMFLMLSALFAEMEGQRYIQRANDRVRSLRHTDRWGWGFAPYGFRVIDHPSGQGKALDLNEDEQEALHAAAEMVQGGASYAEVVRWLNQTTPAPRTQRTGKGTKGAERSAWTVTQLTRLLTSPATQGIKLSDGKPVLDDEGRPILVGPASFSPEVWRALQIEAQRRQLAPRVRPNRSSPLLGVAVCGACGGRTRRRKQVRGTNAYYICGGPSPCRRVSIRADLAEALVERLFLDECGSLPVLERVYIPGEDHAEDLADVEQTIESLRQDRAMGLYKGEEDEARFRGQMASLISRRDALQARPAKRAGWELVPTDETYADAWQSASQDGKRKMLTDAGVTLTIRPGGEAKVHVPPDIKDRMAQAQKKAR